MQTNTQIKTLGVPAYKTFIISCTDWRIDPAKFLDIDTPREYLISRNSGARARPSLPNLLALDDLVTIETVLVIGHTDCGARSFDEDAIRRVLRERAGNAGSAGDGENVDIDIDIERLEFGRIHGEYV
ncbi:hypothetical protein BJY01DRAFT_213777 [Aspergillus pseudoustus]|uniref:Carbonic anhydrase n=1 Tax=Aspergillus pseudoustus TaxID=1810923 RepID=A0ABR4K0R2_9EURO